MTHSHCGEGHGGLAGKLDFLDKPERQRDYAPETLLGLLSIQKEDRILDLGAGAGYLAIPAAELTEGPVFALDRDPQMLEVIRARARESGIGNIQLLEGGADAIPLGDSSVDVVLASLILHEIHPLSATLREIRRVLARGGRVVCLEYEAGVVTADGPAMERRISSRTLARELEAAGLVVTDRVFPKDYLYLLVAGAGEGKG